MERRLGKPLGSHKKSDVPSFEYRMLPNGDKTYCICFHKGVKK